LADGNGSTGARARDGAPPPGPPHRVRVPVNVHDWQRISFLHWPVEPAVLARLLPDEVSVLTFDGAAWVSVTPFFIRVRAPGLPALAGVTAFPETNVRTYVAGPGGREGLWFLRLEVTHAWFVATLRALGLPYVRQRMTVDTDATSITYAARPRSGPGPSHRVTVRPGHGIRGWRCPVVRPATASSPRAGAPTTDAARCSTHPLTTHRGRSALRRSSAATSTSCSPAPACHRSVRRRSRTTRPASR
jgi:hypothetical protein